MMTPQEIYDNAHTLAGPEAIEVAGKMFLATAYYFGFVKGGADPSFDEFMDVIEQLTDYAVLQEALGL